MKGIWVLALICAIGVSCFGRSVQTTSKLTGAVYDAQGSVIVGAKVTALGKDGKKFHAITNDKGIYVLTLPFIKYDGMPTFKESKYDVIVESPGFQSLEIKGYVFVPSPFGKMNLDIGLSVKNIQ